MFRGFQNVKKTFKYQPYSDQKSSGKTSILILLYIIPADKN